MEKDGERGSRRGKDKETMRQRERKRERQSKIDGKRWRERE